MENNYSVSIINGFLDSALKAFKLQYNYSPISAQQDIRGLSIAWTSYIFKEYIESKIKADIASFVTTIMEQDDYIYSGWYRVAALQAASFILTGNIHHRDSLLANISCMQSIHRPFILKSAAMCCPLIEFENPIIKEATVCNIKASHSHFEENLILYICTNGTTEAKKKFISELRSSFPKYEKFFDQFTMHNILTNGYFLETFSEAKSYFLFSILVEPKLYNLGPNLFTEIEFKNEFQNLLNKENKNLLAQNYFHFNL
jgi:hypothetical protein